MTSVLVLLNLIALASSTSSIELSQDMANESFNDICFAGENNVTNLKEYEDCVMEKLP